MFASRLHYCNRSIITAIVFALGHAGAHAQEKPEDYPAKPVRILAASAPGGGIDIISRIAAQKLSEAWSQQVIVENRPGDGNTLATGLIVKAAPDGYTLLAQSMGIAYAGALRELPFDAWYALFAPAKIPRAIVQKINAAMNRALQQPDTRQRLSGLGMEPLAGSEDEFAKFFRAEVAKWNKVIKAAGIKGAGE